MVQLRRLTTLFGATALTLGLLVLAAPSGGALAAAPRTAAQEAGQGATPAGCDQNEGVDTAHCYLSLEPASAPTAEARNAPKATTTCPVDEATGYTPCNLQSAYGLTTASADDSSDSTVAVVDPYDDPNAESDLGVFRSTYGLPACTTANGCFEKVNQDGVEGDYPAPNASYASEISLDLDMVSAICPNCHILLVEANSDALGDLGTAEDEAVTLGAQVVSNSWGTDEFDGETGYDGYFYHPGIAITASSGDGAYTGGVQYPSASPYVTSVGGTELTPASNARGWTETTWDVTSTHGAGSGCSAYEPKPPWQKDTGCANRTTADVSAVASNVLGYNTYDASGWYYESGTSVSSPIIAGIYGLAANSSGITTPASIAYSAPSGDLNNVTTGSTGTCTPTYLCTAGPGYNRPTGLGTPNGIGAFQDTWSAPSDIDGGTGLWSVSCPSVTFCMAVDGDGNALTYNGSSWSAPSDIYGDYAIESVSCPSASFCAAAGVEGDALTYNGSSWSAPTEIDGSNQLFSVSCPSASFCTMVGTYGLATTYNGFAWSPSEIIDPYMGGIEGIVLTSVSCPSANFCMAVDLDGNALTYTSTASPPTTSVIIPASGATVYGTTYLDASASDASSVEFRLLGGSYGFSGPVLCTGTLTYYGWLCAWNTTTVPNGSYALVSEASGPGGSTFSSGVSITVENPPTVSILLPSNGATLSGSTYLDASASNVTSVEFRLLGGVYGFSAPVICTATATIFGWLCSWNSTTVPNGSYVGRKCIQ
jgi:hypothetical protein